MLAIIIAIIIATIIAGFINRAKGWGPDDVRLRHIAGLFNAWSCAALFAILCAFFVSPLVALACGVSYLVWRLPGFEGWEDWGDMFLRGWWTSFAGFILVSYAAHGHPYWGLLSVPFAALYMVIYSGGYKRLPQTILGFDKHVWIEHASGWAFFVAILLIGV